MTVESIILQNSTSLVELSNDTEQYVETLTEVIDCSSLIVLLRY
jgi:hypothetical protein